MYKLQLIRKYLLKRRIAWVALASVMLCTAMVLVVISVMGGWLRAFQESFHGMTSDVVVSGNSLAGFPYYQEMIDKIDKLPDAAAAVPVIRTGAMANFGNDEVQPVQVLGYPSDIGLVNAWPQSLHLNVDQRRKELEQAIADPKTPEPLRKHFQADLKRLPFSLHPEIDYDGTRNDPRNRPGIIVSSALVFPGNSNVPEFYRYNMYHLTVTLTMIPVTGGQQIDMNSIPIAAFWIVDDAKSRVWQLDNNNVYISFEEAQKDLRMDGSDGEARCSEIEIKAKPGVNLNTLRDKVAEVCEQVKLSHKMERYYGFRVETWQEQQSTFIDAVKTEVVIELILFGIVSSVAVLLIFCIFYMIVVEKTKDIGIIKSVGATGWGIMTLFLGYGLAIGVVGAALGFALAFTIVLKINEIHGWIGRVTGYVIFKPETYQLAKIPDRMEPSTVIWVLGVSVLSALIGAIIPAIRAANMNPVDALRYE